MKLFCLIPMKTNTFISEVNHKKKNLFNIVVNYFKILYCSYDLVTGSL